VAQFLQGKLLFTDIVKGCEMILGTLPIEEISDLASVLESDRVARIKTLELANNFSAREGLQINFAF